MNLAPNGKPSNLTPEQYRLVRTPAFKKWFGDWINSPETSSKVFDENSEPLVVYHGSNDIITEFNSDYSYYDSDYSSHSNLRAEKNKIIVSKDDEPKLRNRTNGYLGKIVAPIVRVVRAAAPIVIETARAVAPIIVEKARDYVVEKTIDYAVQKTVELGSAAKSSVGRGIASVGRFFGNIFR
jgi:hypothetical protein